MMTFDVLCVGQLGRLVDKLVSIGCPYNVNVCSQRLKLMSTLFCDVYGLVALLCGAGL